jgi:Tfp pilus assembly protein PilZ
VDNPRAHPRYAVELDAEITSEANRLPARTRNVSHGGLCVEAKRPLPAGLDVIVTLALVFEDQAMSEPLGLRGRIVWCTRVSEELHQLGVTFVGLTGDQRGYVEMFLRFLSEG